MGEGLDFGPRLTDAEYDRRIVALHSDLPEDVGRALDEKVRRRELDLAIDHRLGVDFPQSRRDELWEVARRVERRRLRMAVGNIVSGLVHRLRDGDHHRDGEVLARFVIRAYGNALTEAELRSFLGLDEGDMP